MIDRMISRSLPLCVLASILLCSAGSIAQNAAPTVRIVSPIDESQLVTLRGSFSPSAIGATDRGPVSADLPMAGLTLVLSRSADQQAAFDAFVPASTTRARPTFIIGSRPRRSGRSFGPAQADISTLSGWLSGHGFTVTNVGADGMTIQFRGTAGQVESAFHTQIHNLSVNGKSAHRQHERPADSRGIGARGLRHQGTAQFPAASAAPHGQQGSVQPRCPRLGKAAAPIWLPASLRSLEDADCRRFSQFHFLAQARLLLSRTAASRCCRRRRRAYDFATIYNLPSRLAQQQQRQRPDHHHHRHQRHRSHRRHQLQNRLWPARRH